MKIAIVVGHTSRSQGAVSIDGTSEFAWNSRLAQMIHDENPNTTRIFNRPAHLGYSRGIDFCYSEVDRWGAKCSVELHFNSNAKRGPSGVLTLSSGTPGSLDLAREVHSRCVAVMETRDRGVEVRTRHMRGGRSLWQGKSPAIMAEPFFGSNPEDWRRANARMEYLAEAIYRGCVAFHV